MKNDAKLPGDTRQVVSDQGIRLTKNISVDYNISQQVADLPNIRIKFSKQDSDIDQFSFDMKRGPYNPGSFFDENPYSGIKPLINKTVLE